MTPLLDLLKTGMYHLKTEEAQLKERATEKETVGHTKRNKQSGKTSKNPTFGSMNLFAQLIACSPFEHLSLEPN